MTATEGWLYHIVAATTAHQRPSSRMQPVRINTRTRSTTQSLSSLLCHCHLRTPVRMPAVRACARHDGDGGMVVSHRGCNYRTPASVIAHAARTTQCHTDDHHSIVVVSVVPLPCEDTCANAGSAGLCQT